MRLRLVTPPAEDIPLLTLEEAKAQLRVDPEDGADDALIEALVVAATAALDGARGQLNRCLMAQTWALDLDHFPQVDAWGFGGGSERRYCKPFAIPLPLSPLISIDSVAYFDAAGDEQTLDPAAYLVHGGEGGLIEPAPGGCWPQTQAGRSRAVTITFTAGYGETPAAVPAPIRQAVRLLVAHWYANREAVVGVENRDSSAPLPLGVDLLLGPYRALTV